ncbi:MULTISPECIES: HpcH/HpaI aldolase family protein [unclassified Brevibacterium]|uniref:HpcH/HpaI aldolase family protein n=1 Tax=unclassified Brevibacterium TaxID=2614124 RepID=UPI001091D243|nr:aldolase/citrate lyase family protein [Brevibacterium sp. S22]TGD30031.1 2,4-dihydroxyhept-2-ene-1,7-dioic acid aldolase [Brevibacterium sp. S22]
MAHLNTAVTPLDKGGLAARIRAGETTIGSFAGLGSTMAIEVLAAAGLDWVLVDLEHGGGSEASVGDAVAAAGGYGAATLVRVETPDRIRIGRALDAGAAGVMLPRVDSADEVAAIIPHLHYPPLGDRGVATYNRSLRWGMDKDALKTSDSEVITIVQIETTGALAEVDAIAALDAVDVLFVGPLDLSYALGVPLDFTAPVFRDALDTVVEAARKHGKSAGILSADAAVASTRAEQGFTFLPVGSDSTLLADTAAAVISILRD